MDKININAEFCEPYFRSKRCKNYHQAVDISQHLRFHFDGYFKTYNDIATHQIDENPYFKRLIDMRRPSESDIIMQYRRSVYLPKTKIPCKKVTNSLKKIVKSQDWDINYSNSKPSQRLPDDQTLKYYCEEDYPFFDSVVNWIQQFVIANMLKDPNAVVMILPVNLDKDSSEFYRPFSYIIESKYVLDFAENEYFVYQTPELKEQAKIRVLTSYALYEIEKLKESLNIEEIVTFEFDSMPAFLMGGEPIDVSEKKPLYDSFISGMLPELDAAAQDISDFQAEKVQHVFSTMWYMAGQECNNCMGSGKVMQAGKAVVCSVCEGSGVLKKSPYKDMVIKPANAIDGTAATPTPPAGYITKPTEMVEIMEKIIEHDIYNALSAINMEFLADTPLSQSGKAKEVDRDELNTFVYGVGYHVVTNIAKPTIYYINEWRYKNYIQDAAQRAKQLPVIAVPERFELLTENIVGKQYSDAISNKYSDEIVLKHELDYASKRFDTDDEMIARIKAKRSIDPLAGKSNTEKIELMASYAVPAVDIIISLYIDNFITRAVKEHKGFLEMEYAKQVKIVTNYATLKLNEMKPSERVAKVKEQLEANDDLN